MELDEGLDMVDKAGVGEKNEQVTNDLVMKQTNKQTNDIYSDNTLRRTSDQMTNLSAIRYICKCGAVENCRL